MKVYLGRTICSSAPINSLSNATIAQMNDDWTADKIMNKLGISTRPVLEREESIIDYASESVRQLMRHYRNVSIDCLIYVSNTSDYIAPGNGHLLRENLDLSGVKVFDLNAGCSGFVDGLVLAKSLIKSRMFKSVCLVTGDSYSKYIQTGDFSNLSLFGDAATASLVTASDIDGWLIGSSKTMNVNGVNYLNISHKNGLFMDGKNVFDFASTHVVDLLRKVELDYDGYIFHQANRFMLNYLIKKLKIDRSKVLWNMENYGNTVGSTIPLVLEKHRYVQGKVLLVGFGIGLAISTIELNG